MGRLPLRILRILNALRAQLLNIYVGKSDINAIAPRTDGSSAEIKKFFAGYINRQKTGVNGSIMKYIREV